MKKILFILIILSSLKSFCQRDTSQYDRLEEILDHNKRYVVHNNYLTAGFGYSGSNLRKKEQATLGIDFTFHIKRHHFQVGVLMSGDEFQANNNLSGHAGYVYRIEDEKRNITFFGGISQNKGNIPAYIHNSDTIPTFYYRNTGIYLSAAYVKKITYDIGIGIEGIVELNRSQQFFGVKGILFFSGAYRGKAKVFNRHVKPKKK